MPIHNIRFLVTKVVLSVKLNYFGDLAYYSYLRVLQLRVRYMTPDKNTTKRLQRINALTIGLFLGWNLERYVSLTAR